MNSKTDDAAADLADALLVHAYSRAMTERSGDNRIGPFAVLFSDHSPSPYSNYAIPLDFTEPSPAEVAALIAAFQARDRQPRLEFAPSAAPKVEPALTLAGFTVEMRPPLMTRRPAPAMAALAVEGFNLTTPETDQAILDLAAVQKDAFDDPAPADETDVAALRRSVRRGGYALAAYHHQSGATAGAGAFTPPQNGVTEVVGIAVAPRFRRRGLAQAITGALAEQAFRAGCTMAFLSAAGESQSAIYARAGFIRRSPMAYMSVPPP